MDPMIAKLAASRTKSIKTIEAEVAKLEGLRKSATVAATVVAIDGVLLVKRQRLAKLREELAAFQAMGEDPAQVEVPGTRRKA